MRTTRQALSHTHSHLTPVGTRAFQLTSAISKGQNESANNIGTRQWDEDLLYGLASYNNLTIVLSVCDAKMNNHWLHHLPF